MTPAEIILILQLASQLEPVAVELATKLIQSFEGRDMTPAERIAEITALSETLEPMKKRG